MKNVSLKKLVTMNIIINLPLAIALTITANYLQHKAFSLDSAKIVFISFVWHA